MGKENGLTIVALTGFDGGKVKDMAEIHINIPNNNFGIIEDLHMSIGHVIGQRLHLMLDKS
ncbi:phosphoheptose isomerase NMA0340 [Beggiatoa sp. PS]|nr:phosphoheptose isomerase NMA0340 [Beggiatoa sp. PS]